MGFSGTEAPLTGVFCDDLALKKNIGHSNGRIRVIHIFVSLSGCFYFGVLWEPFKKGKISANTDLPPSRTSKGQPTLSPGGLARIMGVF